MLNKDSSQVTDLSNQQNQSVNDPLASPNFANHLSSFLPPLTPSDHDIFKPTSTALMEEVNPPSQYHYYSEASASCTNSYGIGTDDLFAPLFEPSYNMPPFTPSDPFEDTATIVLSSLTPLVSNQPPSGGTSLRSPQQLLITDQYDKNGVTLSPHSMHPVEEIMTIPHSPPATMDAINSGGAEVTPPYVPSAMDCTSSGANVTTPTLMPTQSGPSIGTTVTLPSLPTMVGDGVTAVMVTLPSPLAPFVMGDTATSAMDTLPSPPPAVADTITFALDTFSSPPPVVGGTVTFAFDTLSSPPPIVGGTTTTAMDTHSSSPPTVVGTVTAPMDTHPSPPPSMGGNVTGAQDSLPSFPSATDIMTTPSLLPAADQIGISDATVTITKPSIESPIKHKRGRPRKSTPVISSGVGVQFSNVGPPAMKPLSKTRQTGQSNAVPLPNSVRKRRSSGPSSKRKEAETSEVDMQNTFMGLGSKWNKIEPSIIRVNSKEDVTERIISFAKEKGSIFIAGTVGTLSIVQLLQGAKTVTFKGNFEILTLSGSFLLPKKGDPYRTGQMSIKVVGADGKVFGGRVHGRLVAASPVQIVGCSITPIARDSSKLRRLKAKLKFSRHKVRASPMDRGRETLAEKKKHQSEEANRSHEVMHAKGAQ